MSSIDEPIFLVGAERSGTTVLRLMLRAHSQISWCNEFEYVVDLMNDEQQWPDLDTYYNWLKTHRIFRASNFKIDISLDYPQLVNSFLRQKKEKEKKPIVGATVHRHFDNLLRIWPKAKFIHIVRDGRDVARSCIGMGWAGNVWTGIERWIEVEHLWAEMKDSLSESQKIEITYESLIGDAENTLEQLCNFIGVSFEPAMLEYYKNTSYDLPNPKLLYQWKTKLSNREIQLIESRIAQMLVERNYELSNLPAMKPGWLSRSTLRTQCWWKRLQFRVNQQGLSLFAADYVARKLNINSWKQNTKLKINAIVQSQLK